MKDNSKNKEWERRRRDRLNDAFKTLSELLPTYDPAKTYAKIDVLEKSAQFIKELRLSSSRLLIDRTENDEKSKLIKELQDEVNKLILRVKQLKALLVQAKITIPYGPSLNILGNRKLKYSNKLRPEDLENEQNTSISTPNDVQTQPSTSTPLKEQLKNKESRDVIEVIDLEPPPLNSSSVSSDSASLSPIATPTNLMNNLPLQTTIILAPCSIQQPQIQMTSLTLQHQILPKINQKIPIKSIRKTVAPKKRKKRTIKPKILSVPVPPKDNSNETPSLNQITETESPKIVSANIKENETPLIEISLSEEEVPSSNLLQLETPKKSKDSFLPSISKSPETPNLIEENSVDAPEKSPTSKDEESTRSLLKRKLISDHDYNIPKKISPEGIESLNNKELEEIMENEVEKENYDVEREPSPSILNENDPQIVLLANTPPEPRRNDGENLLLCSTQSKDLSRLDNQDDIEMMNLSENGKEKRKEENSHNQHAHSIAELIPLHIEDHSHDKISECIARSIGLIDPPEGLMELGPDWSDTTKSPISPTQMFLSMFPLLPREAENSKSSQFISGIGNSGNKSSFFIDAMLPDDTNFTSRQSTIPLTPISTCLAMTPNLTENLSQSFNSFTDSLVNCLSITPGFSSYPPSSTNELSKNHEMESVHRDLFNFNSPHVTSSSLPPIPPVPPTNISSGVSNPSGGTPSVRHHRSHSTGHRPSQTLSSTINSSVTFADIFNPIINASSNAPSIQSNHSTSSILSSSNNMQNSNNLSPQRTSNINESNDERFYHQNNERSFSHENLFAHQILGGIVEEEAQSVHGTQRRDSVQIYHPFDIGNERENRQPYYTTLANPIQSGTNNNNNNSKSSTTPQHINPSQQNEQNKQTINFRPATMTDNYEMTSHTPNQKRSTSLPTLQQNVQQSPQLQMNFASTSNAPTLNNEIRGKSQQQSQFFRSNPINISQSGSFTAHSHPPTISSSDEQINKPSSINSNTNRNYQIQQQLQIAQPQGNFPQQQIQPNATNSKSRKNQNSFSRNAKNPTNSQIDFSAGTLNNSNSNICQGPQQKGRNANVQNPSHLSQRTSQSSEFPNFTFHSMLNDTPSISVSTNQFDLLPRQSQTRSQQKRPYYLPESAQIVHNLPNFDLPFLHQGTNSQHSQHKQQGKDQQLPRQHQQIQPQQQSKATSSISNNTFNNSSIVQNRSKIYTNTGNPNNFNPNIHCQTQTQTQQYSQQQQHQQQQQQRAQPCQNIPFNQQSQEIPNLPLPPLPLPSNSAPASSRASTSMNQQQPIQKSKQPNSGYNSGRSNNNGNNNANNSRPVNWMTDQPPYRKSTSSGNTFSVSKLVGNPSGGSAGQTPSTFSAFTGSNYYAESLLRKNNDWNDINFVPPPASSQVPQFVYQPTQNNAEYNFQGQNYQSGGNQHFNFDNSNFQSSNSSSVSNFNMSSIFPEIEKRSTGNSGGNNPNNCYYPGPPNI